MIRRQMVAVMQMMKVLVPAVAVVGLCVPAGAEVFSIDFLSESASGLDPAAVLAPGPVTHVSPSSIGLAAGDELNALSNGFDSITLNDIIFFSVDDFNTLGATTSVTGDVDDVVSQVDLGQAAGDIFVSVNTSGVHAVPQGQNALVINQHEFGIVPDGIPGGLPGTDHFGESIDNLDAFSFEDFVLLNEGLAESELFFSIDFLSPSIGGPVSADDVLSSIGDGTFSVFADGVTDIGLQDGDDLDALAVETIIDGDFYVAYFSLATGSPTLVDNGLSGADVFFTLFDGGFEVAYFAEELGLDFFDELDALETGVGREIPEPGSLLLFGAGAALLSKPRLRRWLRR